MGLDWCVDSRPRDGVQPEEVDALRERLEEADTDDERSRIEFQIMTRIITPLEALGARRLNTEDIETVDAFRRIWESYQDPIKNGKGNHHMREHWGRPFDEVIKEHIGDIMTNMIKPENEELVAHNRGNPFASLAGLESFRGKRVQYCGLLPGDLVDEAFEDKGPDEMLSYAEQLEQYLDRNTYEKLKPRDDRYREISTATLFSVDPKPGYEAEFRELQKELKDARFWDMQTLVEAIYWLRFWAERGFRMHAWY